MVCDAKSGVSGAGRKPTLKTSFCEVTENFSAYSVLHHRHVPEVLLISGLEEREFSFTAQLIPIDRGILETIYFRSDQLSSVDELLSIYEKRYAGEPFVRIVHPGHMPDLRGVARTNYCDHRRRRFDAPTGRGVVVSAIDNLVKGAAGQAIQNMNLALGFRRPRGCCEDPHQGRRNSAGFGGLPGSNWRRRWPPWSPFTGRSWWSTAGAGR